MYALTTLDELKALPAEARNNFVQQANQLSMYYEGWKAQDNGGYTYAVEIPASKERAPGIHASEISHCLRQLTYGVAGVTRKPTDGEKRDVNMQMRFDIGHAVHAMLQCEFKLMCDWLNAGMFYGTGWSAHFEKEVHIHPGVSDTAAKWNIHSSCDGIFTFDYCGESLLRVGTEIKTKSALEYDKLKCPGPDHIEQGHVYMATLNVPLLWFVYYNKSNSNYTKCTAPYLIQYSEDLWNSRLVPRFIEVGDFAARRELPGRTEGMFCRWCPFTWTCEPPSIKRRRGASFAPKTSPSLWPSSRP